MLPTVVGVTTVGGLSGGTEEAAADAVTTTVGAMPGRVRRHTAATSTRTGKRAVQTVAAHEQVAEHYRRKIRRGELAPGQRLPSIRTIAEKEWSVSTRTAWLAVNLLRSEGWIEHAQGRQPVVVGVPSRRPLASSESGGILDNQGPRPLAAARTGRSRTASSSGSSTEKWLTTHRWQILAFAREALQYRDLGSARTAESLAEVERDVHARRVTPGSFSTLHDCLVDLRWSRAVQAAAPDHPVYTFLDRWAALYAEHPSQRSP